MDVAIIALASICFGSFVWAVKGHFRSFGPMPAGMKLTTILNIVGFGWFFWDKVASPPAALPLSAVELAASSALLAASLGLFWWTVSVNRARPLTLAFSDDQPDFIQMSGPYGYVRHPFYLSYMLFWTATALSSAGLAHWVVPVIMGLVYVRAARQEEAKFAASPIGSAYRLYCARTGMLLPALLSRARLNP